MLRTKFEKFTTKTAGCNVLAIKINLLLGVAVVPTKANELESHKRCNIFNKQIRPTWATTLFTVGKMCLPITNTAVKIVKNAGFEEFSFLARAWTGDSFFNYQQQYKEYDELTQGIHQTVWSVFRLYYFSSESLFVSKLNTQLIIDEGSPLFIFVRLNNTTGI